MMRTPLLLFFVTLFGWMAASANPTTNGNPIIKTPIVKVHSAAAPSFINGATQSLTVCESSSGVSLASYLAVNDPDVGSTLTWKIVKVSSKGSLSNLPSSIGSNGGTAQPNGVEYVPTPGVNGTDAFTISCDDGTTTVQTVINVTIFSLPTVGAITGTTQICNGTNATLADTSANGVWSSSDTAITSITQAGTYTGKSNGQATISYTVTNQTTGCANSATANVNIYGYPAAQRITGNNAVCVGLTTTLTATPTTGGLWSSATTTVGTIDQTGLFSGIAAGTTVVTYTVTNGVCSRSVTRTMTVNALPTVTPIVAPSTTLCVGSTSTFTDNTTGGGNTVAWSSTVPAIATVSNTGVVTAVSAGSDTIKYTVTSRGTGCINAVSQPITVNEVPSAGTISGPTAICPGNTATLASTVSGGTWSSGNTTIATINPTTGVVTPILGGSVATLIYTVTANGCSGTSTFNLIINSTPSVAAITGSNAICKGSVDSLKETTTGGLWSSSNPTIASVSSAGIVTGLADGIDTISYTVAGSSCNTTVTYIVTVANALTIAPIVGTATSICNATKTTLTDATSGGTWSSTNSTIATVTSAGVVTGVSAGTDTILYNVTTGGGCSGYVSYPITINATPTLSAIGGITFVCLGSTTPLTNSTPGGFWISSNNSIATIDQTGVVTGVSAGSVTITYTVTGTGGCTSSVTKTFAVIALPTVTPITGINSTCQGSQAQLADATAGGTWTTDSANIASIDQTGLVTANNAGITKVTYTVTSGICFNSATTTFTVAINTVSVQPITGDSIACTSGSKDTLVDATIGGTWVSSNTAVANIGSTSGAITPVKAGTTIVTYTVTSGTCTGSVSKTITIQTSPTVAAITTRGGGPGICAGSTQNFADVTPLGTWSTTNTAVLTISGTGVATGVGTGTANVLYTVKSGFCSTTVTSTTVNVFQNSGRVKAIVGSSAVCTGLTTNLTDSTNGGTWTSSVPSVATISTSGLLTAISAGSTSIVYAVGGTGPCPSSATKIVTINALPVVPAIGGASTVCASNDALLTDATGGGVWTSSNKSVATVNSLGLVTALTVGTDTIDYKVTDANGCVKDTFKLLTVTGLPTLGAITPAASSVCIGKTLTLSNSFAGGTWSSSNPSVATINQSGLVTGLTAGTVTIKYVGTNSNNCTDSVTTTVTVSALPTIPQITGVPSVCVGKTTTFSDSLSSGAWSSSNTSIVTINSVGIATGIAAGTATIEYTVGNSNGCSDSVALLVTVNALPVVAPITGTSSVCIGKTTTLIDNTSSGSWSIANPSIATINSNTGLVTGITTGTTKVTYTVTNSNSCSDSVTAIVVVNASTASTTPASICAGSSYTFNGNTYSSAGTYTSTLTNSNGCDSIASLVLTVNQPSSSSTSDTVCQNALPFSWNGSTFTKAGTYVVHLSNTNGCDSAATLILTVNATSTSTTSKSVCAATLPYLWNGNSYNKAGTFLVNLTNANGCDSAATLILTVTASTTSTTNKTVCAASLPYVWNGSSYTSAGTYVAHLTNANGCDSAATLILTVNPATTSTSKASVCAASLPYLWNGQSYGASGSYTVHLTNSNGCDSAATLILTVNSATTSTSNASVCAASLPYIWNGSSYNAAGTYTFHTTNSNGCDSAAVLVLTVKNASSSTTSKTICAASLPYSWNGNSYPAAGTYTVHLTNSNGCDSAATLILTVNSATTSTTPVTICAANLPYAWNGSNISTAGTYTAHLTNSNGCDSIATLVLTVNNATSSSTSKTICQAAVPYLWNGSSYSKSGTYTAKLTNSVGCDSVAQLILTVDSTIASTTSVSVCPTSLPYIWNGTNYTASGTYTIHLTNSIGCDSIATLVLTVGTSNSSTTNVSVCAASLPYSWNGTSYTASGSYTIHLLSHTGCDSAATLVLAVNNATTSSTNATICSTAVPYNWNGKSYSVSGTYVIHLTNSNGCDSAATLVLTVNPTTSSTTHKTVCTTSLPYVWNGNSYSATGSYTAHLTNSKGCDSIATLNLTVTNTTTSTTLKSICPSSLPYVWNGTSYPAAGTYVIHLTNSSGCDSAATLVLTVNPTSTSSTAVTICSSSLPYLWNGKNYTASGTYKDTLSNSFGCDSIATLVLKVNPTSTSTTTVTICSSALPYTWNSISYPSAGSYTVHLSNALGCDSAATLVLNVNPTTSSTTPVTICASSLPYVWNKNTYNASGTYTVHLTNINGCDSVATLVLTVSSASVSTTNVTVCSATLPYVWNGKSYTASGSYVDHLTNSFGCDSAATLVLTVNQTPSKPTATVNSPINQGDTIRLAASSTDAGVSFNWTGPNAFSSSLPNPIIANASSLNSGTYQLWATLNGCTSTTYDSVVVNVQGNLYIAGTIANEIGTPVTGVKVFFNNKDSVLTNTSGTYSYPVVANSSYTVLPSKSGDTSATNGVDVIDVLLVQNNILAKSILSSPYKLLAADVNGDASIDVIDILKIKRLILGIDTSFAYSDATNKLWVFVDSSYTFADATNPYYPGFADSIVVNNVTSSSQTKSFVAVRLGDVDDSWSATSSLTGSKAKSTFNVQNTPLELYYDTVYNSLESDTVRVRVRANNFSQLLGLQFTLGFNAKNLTYQGVENKAIPIDFNDKKSNEGNISILWADAKNESRTLTNGSPLFDLVFTKNGLVNNEDININGKITKAAAYDNQYQLHPVMKTTGIITTKALDVTIGSEYLNIVPNPSNGHATLEINANTSKEVLVNLLDNNGKLVLQKKFAVSKGINRIPVDLKASSNFVNGFYYLNAKGLDTKASLPVIINK